MSISENRIFTIGQLAENLETLYKSIEQNRPSGVKGKYFKSLFICTTMGSINKIRFRYV